MIVARRVTYVVLLLAQLNLAATPDEDQETIKYNPETQEFENLENINNLEIWRRNVLAVYLASFRHLAA